MDNNVQKYGEGLPVGPIRMKLLKFIDENFATFNFPRNPDESFSKSENEITRAVMHHLDSIQERESGCFRFINQDTTRSDIGVYLGREYDPYNTKAFFLIEAKRLPTPNGTNRDPNEYVCITMPFTGHGGIERFKLEKHGRNHSEVAMFGYIQDGKSSQTWKRKINGIIRLMISSRRTSWKGNELLKESTEIPTRYCSVHKRKNEPPIKIWHFFEQEK